MVPPSPALGSTASNCPNLPPWMGFGDISGRTMVRGIMRKTNLQEQLNGSAWTRLAAAFPSYFTGDRLTPPW